MTADQLLEAVNAAELSPEDLTALLNQAKLTLRANKIAMELAAIDQGKAAALAAFEADKQAKQAEMADNQAALAQIYGLAG